MTKALYLSLGGTDYSAQIKSATLTEEVPEVDVTNMGSSGNYECVGGIKKSSLAIEFVRDNDLSGLDAAINTALGSTLTFEIRQSNAAVGATNPKRTGSVLVTQWAGITGQLGSAFSNSVTWPVTGAVTRATS
ncbi:MAG TPA: hypothetical protein VD948_10975 [Rhodothermales bacterium]|nr:hypothetical protein [Rhodothermales bacterium]